MRAPKLLSAALLAGLAAAPALASPCGDRIPALDPRGDDSATSSVSLSTGSKAVAGTREGQGVEARDQNTGPATAPALDPKAAQAAGIGGGDNAMQARATLNRARALDQEGNAAGCEEALAEARRQLGPAK